MKKSLTTATLFLAIVASNLSGNEVTFMTEGTDNFVDSDFYQVSFDSGTAAIDRIVFDLSVDEDAFFDFDGVGSFGNLIEPLLDSSLGIDPTNIRFTWPDQLEGDDQPNQLQLEFLNQDFNSGDLIRFAADTDFLGSSTETGGEVFGELGIRFSVFFSNRTTSSGVFEISSQPNTSVGIAVVPEPSSTTAMFAFALMFIASKTRKSQRDSSSLR